MEILKVTPVYKHHTDKATKEKLVTKIAEKVLYKRPDGSRGERIDYMPLDSYKVKQSDADACDIQKIVRKHTADEVMSRFVFDVNNDGIIDVSNLVDYHAAQIQIAQANQQFERLPLNIRQRFGHSPAKMVEFCTDPKNLPEMRALGLARKLPEAPSQPPAPQGEAPVPA